MSNRTALIVDDSSLARMMMRKIFATGFKEWTLVEAKDGEEALSIVGETPLSLALVDFNMPGLNGIELAEKLMENQPELPIHLVTANIQERMRLRAEALGLGFIKKPINPQKIAAVINSLNG
ncbi:MAG: response regulator [Magnetococcales bacterium]|nr:response regulator [Magnetococcales bacterium]